MNRIYKVIWNKTRGMYMVVSELAKGQSKDGRRAVGRKKVAQTAAALAVFFSIVSMGGTSFAADGTTKVESSTSGTAVEVYTKNGTDAQIEAARKYTYRKAAELDTRITNVKEYLEQQTSDKYVSKADAAVQDGAIVKAANTIGENVTNLDAALAKETAARIGADKAQDKVIQAVNDNLVQSVTTINKNVSDGFTALNQADANEAAAREAKDNELNERITNEAIEIHKTTNQLQSDLNTETAAREAGDTALNTRITNVKEYLEQQTSDKYVSKADAAVQDGAIVKANKTIGENVTNLDAALASETAARIGADKAQDKVIQAVNDNLVQSVNTINQNMAAGFNALSQADANELAGRVAADTELAKAVNNGLSLDQDNVLQKNTTSVGEDGTVTTSKKAATTLVMNKGGNNQITLSKNGIKVGLNSTVQDAKGFYAGGDTAAAAKAALNADGSIKGADGKFTVDTAGNVATKGGSIKTNGGVIQTGGGNINTQGGALRTNGGNINAGSGTITGNKLTDGVASLQNGDLTTTGNINAHDIVATGDISGKAITGTSLNTQGGDINGGAITGTTITGTTGAFGSLTTTGNASVGGTLSSNGLTNTGNATTDTLTVNHNATVGGNLAVTGDITGKSLNVGTGAISGGQITGTGLDVGAGTIKTTGAVETGTLETTGNATIGGNLTVDKDLTVNGVFDAKTLSSTVDANNYTTINGGKTQSKNLKMDTATGETKASASTFDETGSNLWAKDDESIGKSTVTADSISQKLSDTGDNPTAYAESAMSQGTDNKYTMTDTVKDGDKTNVAFQSATESSDVITEGSGDSAKTSTFRQKIDQILQEIKTSDEIYSKIDQTVNKTNSTVRDGANSTSVEQGTQDITHTAEQGTISNIAKDLVNTASGNMINTVGGNQTTTVTGDSSLKAENITNEAKNKITNKAIDVETDATSSIVQKVTNDAGSNTSTQLSYQTKEEMSQADGKTASYLRGAAEEKSQLIDGSQKTTVDTIAGQTNTNITDGTNTSNDLQKADQIASSVTDGTNTTVVNQNAGSLASSITDGAKVNNTNNTVDKSEQLIKASDTQYSATSKTATKMEDALVSGGSFIDVIKNLDDAANPFIGSAVTDGTNSTGVTQTAKDITNTAKNGTIANEAKDITNNVTENMTNTVGKDLTTTVGGEMKTTVTGDVTEDYKANLSTTVGGNQTTTVTGDSSLTAENITNKATKKLSNAAAKIENSASTSITDKVGDNVERTMTTKKISESVKDGTKSNSFSKTAEKDINIITDGTNTSTLSQLADSVNTSLKNGTQSLNNKKTVTEDVTKVTDENTGAFSSSSQKADAMTNTVKNGSKSNTVTETASTSEQKLVSGNIIDILKDAENGYVNTTVSNSDGSSSTGVKQTYTDITSTAEQGTITNDAKNLVNKAAESITNTAGTQIQDVVGKSTVTITDTGTTFENTEHAAPIGEGSIKQTTISGNTLETGKATADYVDVNKDLHVMGNTKLDGTLEVAGKSTFKDDVTMDEDLDVKGTTTTDKLVVNNGANITGGTTTDTLHVTSTATFDGMVTFKDAVSMEKDLSVGGNATVTGDVTAKSYKVGDKTYINENGINANDQKITKVADGTIAEGSTDAVNGGQLNATNQRVTTVENRMDGVENRMDRVENRVDNLDNRIDKVGASAAAMANLHPMDFDEDSKVSVAAAMGSYRSETAGALGVFYRPTDRVMLNVSTSFGNGENMVGGGVSFKLGKSSKRLAKAEATNAALAKQVTNLQNRLDALLGVLNPSLSKDFPDVPANHWAYEAVSRLAGNDIVQGYEDGKYHGERTMTRYEMAEIIYNALSKGAKAEAKLVEEFRPELQAMAAQRKA
ncbi:ESPR-type extended signal peptide-containing protein [Acidaminococcus fermentans]|uniref:ESPR-type extended signal peptide-containing protein n=1 Tax=Acidaminococcus fermentans TaxID=905 RepID=UPI00242F1D4B|nr:ESPR-type extended signal peptide-containing protein [Acidaminococcus fermentans]